MVAAALKTILPLIIFVGGIVAIFSLSWKNKPFVVVSTFALTALLFSSPLGTATANWLNRVVYAAVGIHL